MSVLSRCAVAGTAESRSKLRWEEGRESWREREGEEAKVPVRSTVGTRDGSGRATCSNVQGPDRKSFDRRRSRERVSMRGRGGHGHGPGGTRTVNRQSRASQNSFSSRFISTTLIPPTRAYRPLVQNASERAFEPTLIAAMMNRWTVNEEMVKLVIRAQAVDA